MAKADSTLGCASAQASKTPTLQLVPKKISEETVDTLEMLLAEAKGGDLVGLSFAAIYRRGSFRVAAAGMADDRPTFALGTVLMLLYRLIGRVGK